MAKVITNKNINLLQLDKEIGSFGLCIDQNDVNNKIITTADESTVTQDQLEKAVKDHVAVEDVVSIEDKLATVGLTIGDLKAALGL
jgi:hypothetical protein